MSRSILFFVALLTASPAFAFRAVNGYEVVPLPDGRFEVIQRVGAGPSDYWCAAGDYARRVLDTDAVERIFIVRGVAKNPEYRGKRTVVFSLTPPAGAREKNPVYLSLKEVGQNLRSADAHAYCQTNDRDDPVIIRP
jgi:hypothetical protein